MENRAIVARPTDMPRKLGQDPIEPPRRLAAAAHGPWNRPPRISRSRQTYLHNTQSKNKPTNMETNHISTNKEWRRYECKTLTCAWVNRTHDQCISGINQMAVCFECIYSVRQERPQMCIFMYVLIDVVREFVVATQCDQCAQAQAVREKDLSDCVDPHLLSSIKCESNETGDLG